MKLKVFLLVALFLCAASSACSFAEKKPGLRKEVSAYLEKTIETGLPMQLDLECGDGEIEVYSWDRKAVKFEITKKIRGTEDKQKLLKKLDNFNISANREDGRISFTCSYRGRAGKTFNSLVGLKIYIPKRTDDIQCSLKSGKLKFLDDLQCTLGISADMMDIEINRLEGKLTYTGKSGDLRISAGELDSGSTINTGIGNIRIKTDFENAGSYSFETGTGIIELCLPNSLNAVFDSTEKFDAALFENENVPARFRLKSGLGQVDIKRF